MLRRLLGHKKIEGPDVDNLAPDFSLEAIDRERFSLSQSLTKGPVVIAFFKVSCPVCQFTFPFLDRLYQSYQYDPVAVWGISQDNAEKSRLFCEQFGVTFPLAIDGQGFPASKSYGFVQVPSIFLIDREGRIRFRFSGFSKSGLIRLSTEIANFVGRPPVPAFLPSELVPEMRPG